MLQKLTGAELSRITVNFVSLLPLLLASLCSGSDVFLLAFVVLAGVLDVDLTGGKLVAKFACDKGPLQISELSILKAFSGQQSIKNQCRNRS